MKDFETPKTDTSTDAPTAVVKSKGREHSAGADASHLTSESDLMHACELSHPANAAPLANMLGQLQHSHGNTYVQQVVADMNQAESKPESQSTDRAQSLDAGIRSEMESAFGENFGDVRVHTGPEAESLNDQLDARAATRGRDIYFGAGEYNPGTIEGKELVAHELAHVIQQRSSPGGEQAASIGQAGDAFEREADRAAASALSGERSQVAHRSAAPAAQRNQRGGQQRIVDFGLVEVRPGHMTYEDTESNITFDVQLSIVPGATRDTFHITVQRAVGITVIDLSGMNIQVHDPGGSGRRPVIVVVPNNIRGPRLIQVTLTRGNFVLIVTFQLPTTAPAVTAAPAPPPAARPPGGAR